MSENPSKSISRRRFLRAGCLSLAGLGAIACSGAGLVAALRPDPPAVDLPSRTFGNSSAGKVLIAYASATGSTAEIAVAIGEILGKRGFAADVHPVQKEPTIQHAQAVIVGSAVHGGNWMPEAIDWLQDNEAALSRLPVALVTVHFFNRGDDESSRTRRQAYADEAHLLVPQAEMAFFAGRFDQRTTATSLPDWLAHLTPTMDLRDWDKIRDWAQRVSI